MIIRSALANEFPAQFSALLAHARALATFFNLHPLASSKRSLYLLLSSTCNQNKPKNPEARVGCFKRSRSQVCAFVKISLRLVRLRFLLGLMIVVLLVLASSSMQFRCSHRSSLSDLINFQLQQGVFWLYPSRHESH